MAKVLDFGTPVSITSQPKAAVILTTASSLTTSETRPTTAASVTTAATTVATATTPTTPSIADDDGAVVFGPTTRRQWNAYVKRPFSMSDDSSVSGISLCVLKNSLYFMYGL